MILGMGRGSDVRDAVWPFHVDVAVPVFARCPDCDGRSACRRCGGSGAVIDHAALLWRLPDETEERDADAA